MIEVVDKAIDGLVNIRDSLVRLRIRSRCRHAAKKATPEKQALEVYWDENHAKGVDTWGEGTVWTEIQHLLVNCKGPVLDIACGTGRVMEILNKFERIDVYGCDISDMHLRMAVEIGIPESRLELCDATKTDYKDNQFNYSYSIGSLEHFTEEGIEAFVKECHRYTKYTSFHQFPTSRSGKDEGWLELDQSFFNNSVNWWLSKFNKFYSKVYVLNSVWKDPISFGRWFVCVKD